MHKETNLPCPIFQRQEPVIKDITDNINRNKDIKEKVHFAEELLKEVNVLLSCPDYDDNSLNCKNCRTIANLREKAAELVIKTKKLT